jgi:hypothetical protein
MDLIDELRSAVKEYLGKDKGMTAEKIKELPDTILWGENSLRFLADEGKLRAKFLLIKFKQPEKDEKNENEARINANFFALIKSKEELPKGLGNSDKLRGRLYGVFAERYLTAEQKKEITAQAHEQFTRQLNVMTEGACPDIRKIKDGLIEEKLSQTFAKFNEGTELSNLSNR